ncbi:MAG: xylulose 5-phosphate 3-epimerase [Candidatus Rokuibacteriota bacterium]
MPRRPVKGATFAQWAAGYGPIRHTASTRTRVRAMARAVEKRGGSSDGVAVWEVLHAADRVAAAGMWLVVHETYARNVYLDGRGLRVEDFKPHPEGHTGGALNMVPAYTGYLAANALAGVTRSWIMGQGHCVAAVDSVNLLVGNMTPAHARRYDLTDAGLTRYVRDFYSYRLGDDGAQDSPLGSHVNAHTAGGLAEGGYLGFVELQYVHMPVQGERLVAFLSDGAFEEQRGSDWAPRWWRAEDSGLVAPIMIANGRRIDQRTTMAQQGGVTWFVRHLRLNGFDPIVFDGRDPAAFVWAIFEMERRLAAAAAAVRAGRARYPVRLPYGVAVAPKGAGFFGAGTNLAHNLPLGGNPHADPGAARHFNEHAGRLRVPLPDLARATAAFRRHDESGRPRERDHALATRRVRLARVPEPRYRPIPARRTDPSGWAATSPMDAVDQGFVATVRANPRLRPRVGNPDEMRSNRMQGTLDALKFRVTDPEPGIPEALGGAVITALNEEAVASAALANKAGINIIVTYEAFGAKMHGAVRQEIVFADHLNAAGRPPGWLSVPLVLTSHTWENGKNERSHQDPALAEVLLGEPADVSRVLFPADHNTAAAVMRAVYQTRGQIWTLVIPKAGGIPDLFTEEEAGRLLADGALGLDWAGLRPADARAVLTAVGAYQLGEVLRASGRLTERGVAHAVSYMLEPGRFRAPRGPREAAHLASGAVRSRLYPETAPARVFVSHTRPEALLGVLQPLCTGPLTAGLGFINHGGTLDTPGMLFVNGATWAHVLDVVARLLAMDRVALLTDEEQAALDHRVSPQGVLI